MQPNRHDSLDVGRVNMLIHCYTHPAGLLDASRARLVVVGVDNKQRSESLAQPCIIHRLLQPYVTSKPRNLEAPRQLPPFKTVQTRIRDRTALRCIAEVICRLPAPTALIIVRSLDTYHLSDATTTTPSTQLAALLWSITPRPHQFRVRTRACVSSPP